MGILETKKAKAKYIEIKYKDVLSRIPGVVGVGSSVSGITILVDKYIIDSVKPIFAKEIEGVEVSVQKVTV